MTLDQCVDIKNNLLFLNYKCKIVNNIITVNNYISVDINDVYYVYYISKTNVVIPTVKYFDVKNRSVVDCHSLYIYDVLKNIHKGIIYKSNTDLSYIFSDNYNLNNIIILETCSDDDIVLTADLFYKEHKRYFTDDETLKYERMLKIRTSFNFKI